MPKFIVAFLFLLSGFDSFCQSVVYVTPTGAGNASGTSWTNALPGTLLANSIATAASGTQFWVASGTYYPTTTGDRTASFSIASGVSIYGGFAGGETSQSQRPETVGYETILSGDIGIPGDRSDNSMNIIQILNTSQPIILSMITVRDGNRSSTESQNEGVGIRVRATGTPTQLYLYSCTFINNRIFPSLNGGGAILFRADAGAACTLVIQDCLFEGNEAGSGGALTLYTVGGTIDSRLTRSTFVNNRANEGGAISDRYLEDNALNSLIITNCTFDRNIAAGSGGALLIGRGVSQLDRCVFTANSVAHNGYSKGGGAVDFSSAHPTFTNCLFSTNKAVNGGALYGVSEDGATRATLTNCTFVNNIAVTAGGTLTTKFQYYDSNPLREINENVVTLKNCIAWGNTAQSDNFSYRQSVSSYQTGLSASYSNLQEKTPGEGNLTIDPAFVNPASGNFQLQPTSPAVNSGDPNRMDLPAFDLAGQVRVQHGRVDMGAYELGCLPVNCPPVSAQRIR